MTNSKIRSTEFAAGPPPLLLSLLFSVLLSVLLSGLAVPAATAAVTTYTIDPAHSSLHFKTRHFGVSNVWGRFDALSGTVRFDDADPAKSSVEIEVKTESIDSNNERRDTHLRSPDFFNAKQFPVLEFKSTRIEKLSDTTFRVTGDVTLSGVTKSVTTEVELIGMGKHPRSSKAMIGFESAFTIQRSDFGMNFMVGPLGDDVQLNLAIEAFGE